MEAIESKVDWTEFRKRLPASMKVYTDVQLEFRVRIINAMSNDERISVQMNAKANCVQVKGLIDRVGEDRKGGFFSFSGINQKFYYDQIKEIGE